jgi:hypothetical protein
MRRAPGHKPFRRASRPAPRARPGRAAPRQRARPVAARAGHRTYDLPAAVARPRAAPGGKDVMARFLIEVPHEAEPVACARAVALLLRTGSHYLTHADFGCRDGDHRAWIVVEGEDKAAARNLLPPLYRPQARIVGLNRFSLDEVEALLKAHGG